MLRSTINGNIVTIGHDIIASLWRKNITSLPRRNGMNTQNDLRPVSVMCTLSKFFKFLVLSTQFFKHYEYCRVLPDIQSAFRKHGSTVTALTRITDDLIKYESKATDLRLLYFSKAFDTIDRELILTKTKFYHCGVRGMALRWIRNYFFGVSVRWIAYLLKSLKLCMVHLRTVSSVH